MPTTFSILLIVSGTPDQQVTVSSDMTVGTIIANIRSRVASLQGNFTVLWNGRPIGEGNGYVSPNATPTAGDRLTFVPKVAGGR